MGRLGLSFKLFFRTLGDGAFADEAQRWVDRLDGKALAEPMGSTPPLAAVAPIVAAVPARSEALTLLAVLQREARLVDFLKEGIAAYSNEQIGAAVRDVHRDASGVLDRLFGLTPVMSESEGTSVQVPAGADAARVRLVGNVTGSPPYRGSLRHAGWEATKVELPSWTGSDASAKVVAPAEVEL